MHVCVQASTRLVQLPIDGLPDIGVIVANVTDQIGDDIRAEHAGYASGGAVVDRVEHGGHRVRIGQIDGMFRRRGHDAALVRVSHVASAQPVDR